MTIKLPDTPVETNYEDFVTAALLSLGYFVEANLIQKTGSTEILELDAIATHSLDPVNLTQLVEVKSGTTTKLFGDLFKVYGWMTYLEQRKGMLVRQAALDDERREAIRRVSERTNVNVVCFRPNVDSPETLAESATTMSDAARTNLLVSAWSGRIGQRICLKSFRDLVRPREKCEAFRAAHEYRLQLDSSVFAQSPVRRAARLYNAYARISEQLVSELGHGDANEIKTIWSDARDSEKYPAIQYAMVMESTARLGILKNAMLQMIGGKDEDEGELARFFRTPAPQSFWDGLEKLREHPLHTQIPFLMQIFIEVFGGWYMPGDEKDVALLAEASGIAADQLEECLKAFDHLFPVPNGWFIESKGLRHLKAIPAVYRGTGCFLRHLHWEKADYDEISPQMGWLLRKWHNALHNLLEPSLGVEAARETV